jgi:hypothetical protein
MAVLDLVVIGLAHSWRLPPSASSRFWQPIDIKSAAWADVTMKGTFLLFYRCAGVVIVPSDCVVVLAGGDTSVVSDRCRFASWYRGQ